MNWVESRSRLLAPLPVRLEFLLHQLATTPDDLCVLGRAAAAAEAVSKWQQAMGLYERGLSADPDNVQFLTGRGRCQWHLKNWQQSLADLDRALAEQPDDAELLTWRGRALDRLGRGDSAEEAWTEATRKSNFALRAARSLLRVAARSGDGARLLAQCQALPEAYALTALVRGYYALGLSMTGAVDVANDLVRLELDVLQIPLGVPDGFVGLAAFNRQLAREVQSHAYPDTGESPFPRNDHLDVLGATAYPAFVTSVQRVIDEALRDTSVFAWPSVIPPPTFGRLRTAGTVLTGKLVNATHLHSNAYLSGAYHATVPTAVAEADDDRGSLVLGSVRGIADGHEPSWGVLKIRPQEGWLTIFPSHVFHEVLPTLADDIRVSVAFDLVPE